MIIRYLLIIVSLFLSACTITTTATPTAAPSSNGAQCVYRHAANGSVLPDLSCTPGEADSTITQENIYSTICVSGWLNNSRPRPPSSVTNDLKRKSLVAYGQAATISAAFTVERNYEEDHLIAREIGGLSAVDIAGNGMPTNLWAEPNSSPNPKDKIENDLHDLVCKPASDPRRMPLAEAQRRIVEDWTTALQN